MDARASYSPLLSRDNIKKKKKKKKKKKYALADMPRKPSPNSF